MITKKEIEHIIRRYRIKLDRYTYKDGVVDVRGSVMLTDTSLRRLPIKFGRVDGDFYCHANQLKTLKGAPEFVGGDFNCSNNNLISLRGAPIEVGGNFACHENALTSLKGSPQHVKGNFNAFLNQIKTLDGAPEIIEGNCFLYENKLTTLQGRLRDVGKCLHTTGNLLVNLQGIPEFIGQTLSIDGTISSLYMGNQKCQVKKIEIEMQKKLHEVNGLLPTILIQHLRYLPIVFKYMSHLSIFSPDFNESNFKDIIYEIKSGLR